MAILTWPTDLPWETRRDGFSFPFADGRTRTDMEDGPGRIRLKNGSPLRPLTVVIDMSPAEFARLERFWWDDTRRGVLPFWFRSPLRFGLPLVSGAAGLPLLTAAGAPVLIEAWLLCQFSAPAPTSVALPGGRLRVTIALVVHP